MFFFSEVFFFSVLQTSDSNFWNLTFPSQQPAISTAVVSHTTPDLHKSIFLPHPKKHLPNQPKHKITQTPLYYKNNVHWTEKTNKQTKQKGWNSAAQRLIPLHSRHVDGKALHLTKPLGHRIHGCGWQTPSKSEVYWMSGQISVIC